MDHAYSNYFDEIDVVIVGSGVAGALVADKLSHKGIRVYILEAGKKVAHEEAVARYRNSWQRDNVSPYERYSHASFPVRNSSDPYLIVKGNTNYWCEYLRQVGGTTWHWGGITTRFLPVDFKLRGTYGVGYDWPISYNDIESFYLKAEWELGVSGDSEDDHESPRSGSYPMPTTEMLYSDKIIANHLAQYGINTRSVPAARNTHRFNGRSACCGNNTCTPICPTRAKYSADIHIKSAINNGAVLVENAVAYDVQANSTGQIEGIKYKSPDGQSHIIRGKYYILACNAIETPKLLLLSRSVNSPEGVANRSGLVGCGLMDHPAVAIEFLMPEPLFNGRGPQIVSELVHGRDGDFRSQYAAGQIFLANVSSIQDFITKIIEDEKDWQSINEQLEYFSTHYGSITVMLEQLPDFDNRIVPSITELDEIGIPKPEIYFKQDAYIKNSCDYFINYLNKIVNFLGAEKISESTLGNLWPNHIMGTTCMGNDAETSVVDRNCRCHDHPNLFIAGSSVFTTGSTATPTLTIAALSLRLADYLESVIQTENL